jgi:hypothetical protein
MKSRIEKGSNRKLQNPRIPGFGSVQIIALGICLYALTASAVDPRTNSWFTTYSARYARIYTNDVAKTNGVSVTTWSNGSQTQSTPAYSGIQEVYSSSNYVYFRTTGFGQNTMGPWYNDATRTVTFVNLPKNTKTTYRVPRNPTVPGTKTLIGGGTIAYSVDGTSIFDARDALAWNGSTETMAANNTGGLWWRDAWVNEGITFDPVQAHQPQDGTYHYHANPLGTRYLLGDHVNFNPVTKIYTESTNVVTKHSPILGWVPDGFPVYGPYGYSSASNSASGIRRMLTGYALRDGSNGTDNLTTAGRTSVPAWALRAYNVSSGIAGPAVSGTYPLGRYTEDYAYLGDLTNSATSQTYKQGTNFDLDEYNGRWCVTPEFPNGTYAYFTTIKADGSVVYPYIIGRCYYGALAGGTVASIAETVVTNFLGGPNLGERLNKPSKSGGNIVLTWSAIEGGTYRVEAENNLSGSNWTSIATNTASGATATITENNGGTNAIRFYRVARTALAAYDAISGSGGGGGSNSVAPGGSAARGSTVTVTITLPTTPPWPPANAPISSVTLAGTISGTSISDSTQGQVIATFTIPSNAPTGAQNVVVVFNAGPTYTLTGGFTIN